jgi:hypothetical protein
MKKCVILFTIAAIMAQNAFAFCVLDAEGIKCDFSTSMSAVQTTLEEFFSLTQMPAAVLSSLIQNGSVELPDAKNGPKKNSNRNKGKEPPQETNFITLDMSVYSKAVYRINEHFGVTAQSGAAQKASTYMFVSLKRFLFKVDPFAFLFLIMLFLIRARGDLPSAFYTQLRVFSTPNSRHNGIGFFICARGKLVSYIC